jgi:peptide/nickel transport system substrate-binding protein
MTGTLSSSEGLVVPSEDGRLRAWLADSWTTSPDGLSIVFSLRHNAKFHDGTPVTAAVVADVLKESLPRILGPAFNDVREITAPSDWQLRIDFNQPSRFVMEALETPIQKPGGTNVGTGPYSASPTKPSELVGNSNYYLGRPNIDRIDFIPYPTVRAAWAELLRGNIDMLYEVNVDALDSLQSSSDVALYSYVRH